MYGDTVAGIAQFDAERAVVQRVAAIFSVLKADIGLQIAEWVQADVVIYQIHTGGGFERAVAVGADAIAVAIKDSMMPFMEDFETAFGDTVEAGVLGIGGEPDVGSVAARNGGDANSTVAGVRERGSFLGDLGDRLIDGLGEFGEAEGRIASEIGDFGGIEAKVGVDRMIRCRHSEFLLK